MLKGLLQKSGRHQANPSQRLLFLQNGRNILLKFAFFLPQFQRLIIGILALQGKPDDSSAQLISLILELLDVQSRVQRVYDTSHC